MVLSVKTLIGSLLLLIIMITSILPQYIGSDSTKIPGRKFTFPADFTTMEWTTTGSGDTILYVHKSENTEQAVFSTDFKWLGRNHRNFASNVTFFVSADVFYAHIDFDNQGENPNQSDILTIVHAYIPQDMTSFTFIDQKATIVWNGNNIADSVWINILSGNVNFTSPLKVKELHVQTEVGSVEFQDLVVKESATISVGTGDVQAKVSKYKNLEVKARSGSLLGMNLFPEESGVTSSTSLQTETGKIQATVNGFDGVYFAKSGLGRVEVEGENGETKSGYGTIGSGRKNWQVDASSGIGDISLKFKPIIIKKTI
ncbi:hypothetical protein BDR26DRAFT_853745 [Obelidium mucronatum]|nr:hypothetical protein BDR26DRAFT_853745 [Obelidium mucronatum]